MKADTVVQPVRHHHNQMHRGAEPHGTDADGDTAADGEDVDNPVLMVNKMIELMLDLKIRCWWLMMQMKSTHCLHKILRWITN